MWAQQNKALTRKFRSWRVALCATKHQKRNFAERARVHVFPRIMYDSALPVSLAGIKSAWDMRSACSQQHTVYANYGSLIEPGALLSAEAHVPLMLTIKRRQRKLKRDLLSAQHYDYVCEREADRKLHLHLYAVQNSLPLWHTKSILRFMAFFFSASPYFFAQGRIFWLQLQQRVRKPFHEEEQRQRAPRGDDNGEKWRSTGPRKPQWKRQGHPSATFRQHPGQNH